MRSFLLIWSHLLKEPSIENFSFCTAAVLEAIQLSFTILIFFTIIDNLYFKVLWDKTSNNSKFLEAKSEAKNLFHSFQIANEILIKMDLAQ